MNYRKFNYFCSRTLQELAFLTGSSIGKPTSAIILLTNRCNARCVHCQSWKLDEGSRELDTQAWQTILEQLRKWLGPAYITFTGGETLLRQDAIHLAGVSSRLGFWTEFLTNGFKLNPARAVQLVDAGVDRVTISFDSTTAEVHDLIRGRKGFFEKAASALKMLAEEKMRRNNGLAIWAKTTIMSHNVDGLEKVAVWARDNGIDGVLYQALSPVYYSEQLTKTDWYENNPLWIKEPGRSGRSIEKLKKLKGEGFPIINTIENLEMIKSYFQDPVKLSFKVNLHNYEKKKPQCKAWTGGLQVMPDGGLKMCHSMQPFAYAKKGEIKDLWKKRRRCWQERCLHHGA